LSLPVQAIETSNECQAPSADPHDTEGAVASRLIVTDWLAEPPPLVAVHVNVTPVVSAVTLVVSQPVDVETADSGSVTDQLTSTLLVYQSSLPKDPVTVGVMIGADESKLESWPISEALSARLWNVISSSAPSKYCLLPELNEPNSRSAPLDRFVGLDSATVARSTPSI